MGAAKQASAALAKQNQPAGLMAQLNDLFNNRGGEIQRALAGNLKREYLQRVYLSAISRQPELLQCDAASHWRCILEAAQVGLPPIGPLGHAYLIARNNSKTGKKEATFMIGYRGLITLALRSGEIFTIDAEVVYSCDVFDVELGIDKTLKHKPCLDRPSGSGFVCAYAISRFKDGHHMFKILTKAEVEARRASSGAKGYGPWATHYDEMAKKSAIRALCKLLPLSIEDAKYIARDELREAGIHDDAIEADFSPVSETENTNINGVAPELANDEPFADSEPREPGQEG